MKNMLGSKSRYLQTQVKKDLEKKMVFIGGPRQVGKTTLAKSFLDNPSGYLNWDAPSHREKILTQKLPNADLWIFDELHHYRSWRNYLKGIYDLREKGQKILVTGSARLDYYRFGGDSLQGRYHYLRLHPLSVAELGLQSQDDFEGLIKLGGFPEPYFSASESEARRWSREYRSRLVQEDLRDLESVDDLSKLELLLIRLPQLVGSPLSINGVREDLQASHKAVARWVMIFERLYALFRIPPFGAPKVRAVKKEQKHYHFDWTVVKDPALRFENLVACHLLKWVHFKEDTEGRDLELRYFRDIDGREVDFVVVEDGKPQWIIECKWSDSEVSRNLKYFKERFPTVQAWQLLAKGKDDYRTPEGIRVCHALKFLKDLI